MAKRGLLDVACPAAKRVVVDGVGGGSSLTAENRTVAQELLRGVLAGLLVHKTAADFPLKCVATVLSEVAPLLDGPYNSNDSLLLRAETGPGRNLGLVLLLAAATVAGGGLDALKAERAAFDDSLTLRTRNWVGWAKRVRRTSPLLAGLSAGRWSTVRAAILQATDGVSERGDAETDEYEPAEHVSAEHVWSAEHEPCDDESRADPSADVVRCFQDHGDAVSIATLDLTCDCCDIAWTKCRPPDLVACRSPSLAVCHGPLSIGIPTYTRDVIIQVSAGELT
jgi:hypothetical protein